MDTSRQADKSNGERDLERADGEAAALLGRRYGGDHPAELRLNGVIGRLLDHRSVRAFLPDALPAGTLETLVAAAQSASTSSNLQLWGVVAVEEPGHKAELAKLAGDQQFIREAPLFLVWLADFARLRLLARQQGDAVEGADYIEALILGVVDAALAAQNAVVALESLGLGSTYVGAVRNAPEAVAASLELPPHIFPVFGLAVGHPDPARPASVKPRLPQSAVLHREVYSDAAQAPASEAYDTILAAFWRSQSQEHPPWSRHSVARMRSAQSLRGRDRLREILVRLGFPLR